MLPIAIHARVERRILFGSRCWRLQGTPSDLLIDAIPDRVVLLQQRRADQPDTPDGHGPERVVEQRLADARLAGVLAEVEGLLGDGEVQRAADGAKGKGELGRDGVDLVARQAPGPGRVDLRDVGRDGRVQLLGRRVVGRLHEGRARVQDRRARLGEDGAVNVQPALPQRVPAARALELGVGNLASVLGLVDAAQRQLRPVDVAGRRVEGEDRGRELAAVVQVPVPLQVLD